MINFTTSKELRQKTCDILGEIKKGERYVIAYRGKPVALMLLFPAEKDLGERLDYFISWNAEHFRGKTSQTKRPLDF